LYDFAIIDGDAIKDAYHFENYAATSGTLGSSCMRHRQCQSYFDIYTKFPDKVKMAVLKRGSKIAARSIMWNIEGKFMFDRIYYTTNETQNLLKNTLEAAGYSTLFSVGGNYSMEIDLEGITKFPYLDTLCNYDLARKILTNGCIEGPRYEFRNTGGDYYQYNSYNVDEDSDYTCSCCDNTVHYDTTIYVERGLYRDLRVCEDCAIYSESTGEYHTTQDDTVNTYQDDSILTDEGIRLLDNTWAHQDDPELRQFENDFGYFILDEHDYLTDGNVYYHPNDENKPENLYDSEEVERRNKERLSQIMANNSLSCTPTNMEFAENIPTETPIQVPVEPLINSMGSITYHRSDLGVLTSTGNVAIGTILPTNNFNVTYPYTLLSENEIEEMVEIMIEDNNEEHLI